MSERANPGGGEAPPSAPRPSRAWQAALPWLIAIACFAYLYSKLNGAAAREGEELGRYLANVFKNVPWGSWLALMIPYSILFFVVDTAVVWRVVGWFNAPVRYRDMLPIRGSSYILSILNEQVGKGAMGIYLNRRHSVPGWEVGSSMLFIMFCEFYYLLSWATLGYWLTGGEGLPGVFSAIPWIFGIALGVFALFFAFFSGAIAPSVALRDRPIFHAFRNAKLWHYPAVMLLRSPAIVGAIFVYTSALRLFGVDVGYATMLGYLPVIFFGAATPGPMRTVAITLWVVLFREHDAASMAAFGLVQHNFFIFFNAAIGLLFLRRANRELFGDQASERSAT